MPSVPDRPDLVEGRNQEFSPEPDSSEESRYLSPRGVLIGMFFGTFLCVMNIYFGLKTGHVSGFPIVVVLLSWLVGQYTASPLTRNEHLTTYIVSTTLGAIALPSGLLSIVPAVRYFLLPEDGGGVHLTTWQLICFALSMCLPAPFLAGMFYPAFHSLDFSFATKMEAGMMNELHGEDTSSDKPRLLKFLKYAASVGSIVNIVEYVAKFDCLVRNFPLGLIGLGIVLSPQVILSMFVGSVARLFLLPRRSIASWWSVIPSDEQYQGANTVIIIAAISVIAVEFAMLVLYAVIFLPLRRTLIYPVCFRGNRMRLDPTPDPVNDPYHNQDEQSSLLNGDENSPACHTASDGETAESQRTEAASPSDMVNCPRLVPAHLNQGALTLFVFAISCVIFEVGVHRQGSWLTITLSVMISIVMGGLAVYLMGVTSQNQASAFGKISQFVFVGVYFSFLNRSRGHSPMIMILYSGGRAGATAGLAADVANNMAIADATATTSPRVIGSQVIAILVGCPLAVLCFVSISGALLGPDPSKGPFSMPTARLYVESARLALQDSWLDRVNILIVCLGVFFAVAFVLKRALPNRSRWVPNSASFALGLYLPGSQIVCLVLGFFLGCTIEGCLAGHWMAVPGSDSDSREKGLIGGGLMFGESLTQVLLNRMGSILSGQFKPT